jgi:cytochrome c5
MVKSSFGKVSALLLGALLSTGAIAADDGAAITQGLCFACHQAGMNGAPKFANKVAWAPRIAQGKEKLYEHAIKGLRGMPPRGGGANLTDDQVKAAVDYMVKASGGYPAETK